MASIFYDSFIDDALRGNVNVAADTFFMMLVTSAYTPVKASHAKRSSITNEVTGTGYTAGGQAVTVTLTAASGNSDLELINFADNTWAAPTSVTARGAVVYKRRGGAASADELVAYVDFTTDFTSTAGTFVVHMTTQFGIQN